MTDIDAALDAEINRLYARADAAEALAAERLRHIERLESFFPDGIPAGYGPDGIPAGYGPDGDRSRS